MSGLEVVGVVLGVLGALPAALDALNGYRSLLSSIKNVDRDLRLLIRDLGTEQIRLQWTCEKLLEGIAKEDVIDVLINNPFGPEWEPYKNQLRLRLWTSSVRFQEQAKEMQEAANELKQKLNIQADGKTHLNDRLGILNELKRGGLFTLKKKNFEDILDRIKSGNSILQELIGHGCELEPSRQRRSQVRLIKLLRGLAKSLFQAIRNAITCPCPRPHEVCLELVPRNTILVPSDSDNEVGKHFTFHIAFGTHGTFPIEGPRVRALELQRLRRWDTFDLRLGEFEAPNVCMSAPCPPTSPTPPKSQQRVGWAASFTSSVTKAGTMTSTQTLVSKTLSMNMSTMTAHTQSLLSNLCRDLIKQQKKVAMDCHGYIKDSNREFGLYPRQEQSEVQEAVTLRHLLSGEEQSSLSFDYPQRLKVALAIATSVLHLYQTPWLARTVTLYDFVFLRKDVSLVSGPDSLERPFVAKSVSKNADQGPPCKIRPVNVTVLSLGALLTQVMIGKTVEDLNVAGSEDMDINTILTKHEAGTKLNYLVLQNGGDHYSSAVKWCFDHVFSVANLESDEFCQSFYTEVVARMEGDMKQLVHIF